LLNELVATSWVTRPATVKHPMIALLDGTGIELARLSRDAPGSSTTP
jgi:hypothetical protein